jgi:outer membrane protein OmpA-like peptidoglycan-associated protein
MTPKNMLSTHRHAGHMSAALILALLLSLAPACAPPPKPQELEQVEQLWQDPETRELKSVAGAKRHYDEAYQFRLRASEAYNDGELDISREYAIRSMIKVRTARAIALQFKAKDRLDAANAAVSKTNPELEAVNQERNKLVQEVGQLEIQVTQAKRKKEDEQRRLQNGVPSQFNNNAANPERLAAVDNKLLQAERARDAALAVNADKHSGAIFNRANNQLKSAQELRKLTPIPYDDILTTADQAIMAFNQSATGSKGDYKEEVAKEDPVARRNAMLKRAQAAYGSEYAFSEGSSVRVIIPQVFVTGTANMTGNGSEKLKQALTLATEFDEFTIRIESFTSRGDATESLAISQIRARAARDFLTSNSVKDSRIEVQGNGQDRPRYPNEPSKNDRLEIVFTRLK